MADYVAKNSPPEMSSRVLVSGYFMLLDLAMYVISGHPVPIQCLGEHALRHVLWNSEYAKDVLCPGLNRIPSTLKPMYISSVIIVCTR